MSERNFFAELKRRNVYKVAIAYAVVGWLVIQVSSTILPTFHAPEWVVQTLIVIVGLGFPIALVIAWAFEMTPEGIKRTEDVSPDEKIPQWSARKFAAFILVVVICAAALLGYQVFRAKPTAAPEPVAEKSIAVLPLVNQSGDASQEYFSDGLSEELINVLGQIRELRVIGRNSSFRFKGKADDSRVIGQALRVANVLEGSVRKAGDRVRISVQLVDTTSDSQRWSQTYDRELKDVFAVQEEIAKTVADQLRVTLLGNAGNALARPSNQNLDAYNAYLQGKYYFAQRTPTDNAKALALFEEAIRLDPNYAEAYVAKARAFSSTAYFQGVNGRQGYEDARRATQTALALKPELAEAHGFLAYIYIVLDCNIAAAEAELSRVQTNEPFIHTSRAILFAVRGEAERAIVLQRKAIDSDPGFVPWYTNLATTLLQLGKLEEAEAALRKALDLQPAAQLIHANLSLLALLRGQGDAALHEAELEPEGVWRAVHVALAHNLRGDRAAADAALENFIAKYGADFPLRVATVYAARADADKTFEWLDRAYAARQPFFYQLVTHPLFKPYRADPRFAELCKKANFPVPK